MTAPALEIVHESTDRARVHLGDGYFIILRRVRHRWIAHERRELWVGGSVEHRHRPRLERSTFPTPRPGDWVTAL